MNRNLETTHEHRKKRTSIAPIVMMLGMVVFILWLSGNWELIGLFAMISGLILIITNPVWGVGLLIGIEPLINLLPRIGISGAISPAVGGVTLAAYFLHILRKKYPIKPMSTLFMFLLFWFMVSNLIGQYGFNIPSDRNWAFTYLQVLLMVWIIFQIIESDANIELIMKIILGLFLINSLFALLPAEQISGISQADIVRLSGLSGNPNEFAIYASIGILFCLYFVRTSRQSTRPIFYLMLTIFAASVLFSGSRGSLLFLIISILNFFIHGEKTKFSNVIFLALIVSTFIGVWQLLPDDLQNRFVFIPQIILAGDDTVGLRYQLWRTALDLWSSSIWFGIGLGGFVSYNSTLLLMGAGLHSTIAPHNMFISILTENGLFGFIPFVLIFIITIVNYYRAEKNAASDTKFSSMVVTWQSVFLFVVLTGIKASFQYYKIIWFPIAIGLALYALSQGRASEKLVQQRNIKNTGKSMVTKSEVI